MKKYDVVIIGAGPAGLMCALKLSKKGQKIAVLERLPSIRRKVCGEYLCPKGVELLEKEGLAELLSPYPPISGMNLFSPKGKKVEAHFLMGGLALNRQHFDQDLCNMATKSGVDVFFQQQVSSINYNPKSLVHYIKTLQDDEFETKLLIGADGRSSFVSKHFDLTLCQEKRKVKKIALHLHVKTLIPNTRQGEMHLFSGGDYIGLDPSSEWTTNITLVCDQDKLKNYKTQELLLTYLNRSENLKHRFDLGDNEKIEMVYPLGHHTSSVIAPQVALVGDAASFIDPLTGEGIYQALLSGHLLAQAYPSLENYKKNYKKIFRQKKYLNTFFQFFIRRESLIEGFALLLIKSQPLADIFINIIGNIYTPLEGIFKIFKFSRRTL